eukprot:m51a1_g9381 hypothetical protein (399) ;mRNA; r:216026-218621
MVGGGGVLALLSSPTAPTTQRGKIALELLSTERSYVRLLECTVASYAEPLRLGACPSLPPRYVPMIFANIDAVLGASRSFLRDLERHLLREDYSENGEMMPMLARLGEYLAIYGPYVKNHHRAILVVNKKVETCKEFAAFLQRAKDATESKLDLLSCLIAPVQRIPRYKLLLADLHRNTDEGHPDKAPLARVVQLVGEAAARVDAEMERHERFDRVIEIQRAFVGGVKTIATADRLHVRDGMLSKRVRQGTLKQRWFFLFSDCLLYAKVAAHIVPGSAVYKGHNFSLCRVLTRVSAKELDGLQFVISAAEKSFTVSCSSLDEKHAWVSDICSVAAAAAAGSLDGVDDIALVPAVGDGLAPQGSAQERDTGHMETPAELAQSTEHSVTSPFHEDEVITW